MPKPETRPAVLLLPEHVGKPIGPDRPLTVFEEIDMLAAGKTREDIAGMTPESLENLADATADQSDLFIGS